MEGKMIQKNLNFYLFLLILRDQFNIAFGF